jgi:hypothetical protein
MRGRHTLRHTLTISRDAKGAVILNVNSLQPLMELLGVHLGGKTAGGARRLTVQD